MCPIRIPQSSIIPPFSKMKKKIIIFYLKTIAHTRHDEFHSKQHPWEVHSLELCSEPEADDGILVYLAPHVQNGHHHGVHQNHKVQEESDYDRQDQVEQ